MSTREIDRLYGASWLSFLANCKFTLTSESGASHCDPSGHLQRQIRFLRRAMKEPSNDQIMRILRLNHRPEIVFSALSGRFFESAMLGVCQVMPRQAYPVGIQPWIHYLPLDTHMRNIKEILAFMKSPDACQQIADNCFHHIMADSRNTYRGFVANVFNFLGLPPPQLSPSAPRVRDVSNRETPGFLASGNPSQVLRFPLPSFEIARAGYSLVAQSITDPWVPAFREDF